MGTDAPVIILDVERWKGKVGADVIYITKLQYHTINSSRVDLKEGLMNAVIG